MVALKAATSVEYAVVLTVNAPAGFTVTSGKNAGADQSISVGVSGKRVCSKTIRITDSSALDAVFDFSATPIPRLPTISAATCNGQLETQPIVTGE